jgi:hypothetical protein
MPFFCGTDGQKFFNWRSVELDLNVPYFFVEYVFDEEHANLHHRKFFISANELIQFCNRIRSTLKMKLKQVAILAPPWINKKDTWQLIDLTLILHVEFESGSPMIPVYVALDGRQLSGQMKVIDLQKAKKVETVFLM